MRVVVATVLLLGVAGSAHAAQTTAQQKCVNELNKQGAKVAKDQGKASLGCLKDAANGSLTKLGIPPQVQTAQACLTNDVRGRVGRDAEVLASRDASLCRATPEQLPPFAYSGAAATQAAVTDAALGLAADLFGPNLDAALVSDDDDHLAALCQQEVFQRTQAVVDILWKDVLGQKKAVLAGKERLTGSGPVNDANELAAELAASIESDDKRHVGKIVEKLVERTVSRCTGRPLALLFPGACTSATPAALAACAEKRARARFWASLADADVLDVECDLLDDGLPNGSCSESAVTAHVLDRVGYGPDAWSRARIAELGVRGYIQEQLSPQTIDDSALDTILTAYPSLAMSFSDLRANYPNGGTPGRAAVLRELQYARILRAIVGKRQLETLLTDFWLNHFNVDAGSSARTQWDISPYERIAIRPHVLGKVRDLLLAVARSPAMGDYLDNRLNRVGFINENWSREVQELHTLSVGGGYTETDVKEVARCFTGWREDYNAVDGFRFQVTWHDQGQKTLYGGALVIPPNGSEQDAITLIDFLSTHPSTAAFLSRKLVVRFVNENPPPALVAAATTTYLATGGDIRAVLETILLSDEFLRHAQHRKAKVKRPLVLMASLARVLGATPQQINLPELRRNLEALGESPYEAPPPPGFPDASGYWTSPGTLVTRMNEIERRARGQDGFSFTYPVTGGTSEQIVDGLAPQLLPGGVSDETRALALAFADDLVTTDLARVQQVAAFLLSSPEFLRH